MTSRNLEHFFGTMSFKFGKNREVDSRYLNVPVKYLIGYLGSNPDGKDKYEYPSYEEWVLQCQKTIEHFELDEEWDLSREAYEEEKKSGYLEKELVRMGKDKTLCIVDIYGKKFALVAWRNNHTCKVGMTRICKLIYKDKKVYINYRGKLILISDPSGWVW